jgi:serine/threonine protein kinase
VSQDPTISQDADDLLRARERSTQRLRPPLEVTGFEFERFLGAGAYGEVWVAVDRNTGRRVAVKFYTHRGGVDWSLLSREVEKLAFLFADRYVVQLIDVGWDADPPYYVMEFLERGSLADRLHGGPLSITEATSVFRDVTIGLIHAHDKGVLHCDLKPANILLDQDGRPRLADFGQSRLSHEQTPALGTLFYMAPEQADLNSVPDARWDVYALGALLYCMLTGEPPHRSSEFLAEIEQQVSLGEKLNIYRKLIRESPAPAKHRDVPGVDRDLEEIIERCLQAQPSRRFPNPQAVLQALDARNQRRTRRPLLVLGAVGPAVLLGVLTWFAWSTYSTAISESDAALTRRAIETNGFAAQFVAETVASQIDRRWKTIERIADDSDLRTQLTRITTAGAFSADDQKPLQTWIERVAREHPDVQVASWVVMDGRGNQLARAPYSKESVGKNYAFRDYFNGQGDISPKAPGIEPIRDVHLSTVFVSTATRDRKVAFSCPVWSDEAEADKRRVVGVLSVTVALGQFAELRSPEAAAKNQVAALVDSKSDSEGKAGSILEHPGLATAPDGVYFDADPTARLKELCKAVEQTPPEKRDELAGSHDEHYLDKVGGEYHGRWLAAFRPVIVGGRGAEGNTGWVVVVQERHEAALRPVKELGDRLMRYGLTALGIVVAVVTALWGFVIVVLNESPRYGLARWLRKAGLSPAASNSATSAGTNSVMTDRGPIATATLRQPLDPSDR